MVVHKCKKDKVWLLKSYAIKIKTENNVASQKLKAAKELNTFIERKMRQNTKRATFKIDNIKNNLLLE